MKFTDLAKLIEAERTRQIEKHNLPRWHDLPYDGDWFIVLSEEFGEVAREIENLHFRREHASRERLAEELVQLITVAAAWLCDEE